MIHSSCIGCWVHTHGAAHRVQDTIWCPERRQITLVPNERAMRKQTPHLALAHMRLFILFFLSREVHVCLPVDGRMDNGIHITHTAYTRHCTEDRRSISHRRCRRVHNNTIYVYMLVVRCMYTNVEPPVWIIAGTHDMPHIIMIISLDERARALFFSHSCVTSFFFSMLFLPSFNVRAFFRVLILILYLPIMLCFVWPCFTCTSHLHISRIYRKNRSLVRWSRKEVKKKKRTQTNV